MKFSSLPEIATGKMASLVADEELLTVVTDSRKSSGGPGTCFFAIRGVRHDAHRYLADVYRQGVRLFVVEQLPDLSQFPQASFFLTADSLMCLQQLARAHRSIFSLPVVGITGSNGKTIIKEWLYQLLAPDFFVAKTPGSYNSQLGVPLSVMQLRSHHQLALFEAGVSQPGEMSKLASIIQPTIGVFTNIGPSHDQGFENRKQKIEEKLKLFDPQQPLVYCADHHSIDALTGNRFAHRLAWGVSPTATVPIQLKQQDLAVSFKGTPHSFHLPFADAASMENLIHCIVLLLHLKIPASVIQERIGQLRSIPMRLEMKQAVNQCLLIDDSYNNDLAGLHISLNFLSAQQKKHKVLVLSDILQSGLPDQDLAASIAEQLKSVGLQEFIGVGPVLHTHATLFSFIPHTKFYRTTDELLERFDFQSVHNAVILVKGARVFQLEKAVQRWQRKIHGTVMEVDLNAMVHNLNYFRSKLAPGVKIMVMVKAFAYGSGSEEVANLLQYHKVDYLGVAYADEGVDLRKNHITLPIMVMNPSEESFATILEHQLEPEVYSLRLLNALVKFLNGRPGRIHLKVDTGMHRLGFDEHDLPEALRILKQHPAIQVQTVFTHLAASDESRHDAFSHQQAEVYHRCYQQIHDALGIQPIRHVLNSPGILRFPEHQLDMVRLGIGLYGIDPTASGKAELRPVATLKTVISQIKKIPKGESIGYGRNGVAAEDTTIATIAIGYADGFSRAFSRGKGKVSIRGQRAPVIGNVCMDMTMVDITGIPAQEGDEVVVFGPELPIEEVAASISTIPYEILTNTSDRVKRVYVAESI